MASGINLFVAPLDKRMDDVLLRDEFAKFGHVFSAVVAKDELGASKGFGFVHFSSANDGLKAMAEMNGKRLYGTYIKVEIGKSQEDGKWDTTKPKASIWTNDWNNPADVFESESCCDARSETSDGTVDDFAGSDGTSSDIKERMRRLFETQCYTDVTFYAKDNRKMSISAHRAVLAIGSPLFTKMLFGDQNEFTPGVQMEVQISNLPFEAFTNIVKYMYTDEVFFENDTLVQGILEGAKQFGIDSLVSRCKQYFESVELTPDNVCLKLQLSISTKIDVLKERCIEFIQRNTLPVINSSEFRKCTPATVRTLCKLQSLNLKSEEELLGGVMRWLHAQPPSNRKALLEPLLKCIRFLTFTVTGLGDMLKRYPELMPSDESLSMMLYLSNPPKTPDFKSMPSWLNKNTTSRCFYVEDGATASASASAPASAAPRVVNPRGALVGKIVFPLRPDPSQRNVEELTSLLQLKCISGFHTIKAIKLSFERPASERSMISSLTINVQVHPRNFKTYENVQIVNSESVRVEFKKPIKVRRGDLVDIEAEAKNIKMYKFLQFDEEGHMPLIPHFNSCVSSRPKQQGKLYFINEVEYGPQERAFNRPQEKANRPQFVKKFNHRKKQ